MAEIATAQDIRHQPVDPFGAMPRLASCIHGLGGDEPPLEAGYAFAMQPVAVRPGRSAIAVTFHALRAVTGTISVDLTAVAGERDGVPVRISTKVVPLADLMASGGRLAVEFVSHSETRYAVSGTIHGDHPIYAAGIEAELLEGVTAADMASAGLDPGAETIEPGDPLRLANLAAPSFVNPVSQPMTQDQLRSGAFARWADELHLDRTDEARAWTEAYVMQALSRYGAIAPGARGTGIHVGAQSVPALLVAKGCSLSILEHRDPLARIDGPRDATFLSRPAICPEERFLAAVGVESIDLQAPEVRLDEFDFAWSVHLDGLAHFEDSFWLGAHRLRSGGIYVHIFAYDPNHGTDRRHPARERVERLALNAVSFGHDVAELKFRRPATEQARSPERIIPFALIIRHA